MKNETQIFPPKEVAMELKKVGFNEPCVGVYTEEHAFDNFNPDLQISKNQWLINVDTCTAPTYDQVIGWFAEVHGIDIHVVAGYEMGVYWTNIFLKNGITEHRGEHFPNRQQSLLTAFEEALKLIQK